MAGQPRSRQLHGVPTPDFIAERKRQMEVQRPDRIPVPRGRRPRRYSKQIGKALCEALMRGSTLKEACRMPGMPSKETVMRWFADPAMIDFREAYYYARRVQAEMRVDEIFDIADNNEKDWKPVKNAKGEIIDWRPNTEAIQRSKVRIEARMWFGSKMLPRLYGDKQQVDLDVTGDLAELMKRAANKDEGLPPPIEGEKLDGD